jgi:hypothetical protein
VANENKHIETPAFDKLTPKLQAFVTKYCQRFQIVESAKAGGAASSQAHRTGKKWLERSDVSDAIQELMKLKRGETERSKSALIERLLIQSTVSLSDLTYWDIDTTPPRLRLLPPHKIDEQYQCCAHFARYTREGDVIFEGSWQDKAIKQLSSLMLWDKEGRNDLPAVTFSFGSLKREPYKAPD